jgi:hypothetical protein
MDWGLAECFSTWFANISTRELATAMRHGIQSRFFYSNGDQRLPELRLISSEHNCIFVHVPKTGGTSIEHAILDDLGSKPDDKGELLLGPNPDKGCGPRRLNHFTAAEFVKCGRVSREVFNAYYKFGFVRDPWDRVVSTYKYLRLGGDFKRFVCDILPNSLMESDYYGYFVRPQHDYLYDSQGNCLVDFVGRFERLYEDFGIVARRVKLNAALPHKNRDAGSGIPFASRVRQTAFGAFALSPAYIRAAWGDKQVHPSPRAYYDSESAGVVGELYKLDASTFGYAF